MKFSPGGAFNFKQKEEKKTAMKNFEKRVLAGQSGFTLIEIIAVLVILGILAAVAVPKFIDLTEDAQDKALDSALAAGFSNVTLSYSRYILRNGTAPTTIVPSGSDYCWQAAGSNTIEADLGDYLATYTPVGSNTVQITVTSKTDSSITKSQDFALP